jgi:CDP-diacylglycerol---glycerol-3-phosphate 3-phosphatidyltransferase
LLPTLNSAPKTSLRQPFMITLPNLLSFLRIPLAFVFLLPDPLLRGCALLGAMATDFLDGYLARRYQLGSKLGTLLDPFTDKFFVLFVLALLYQEGQIALWEAMCMLARDGALIVFTLYLVFTRRWNTYQIRAIWSGKVSTTFQLFVLGALALNIRVPAAVYLLFLPLGAFALLELFRDLTIPEKIE